MNTIQIFWFDKVSEWFSKQPLHRKMKTKKIIICLPKTLRYSEIWKDKGTAIANKKQNLDVIVPQTQQGTVVFHERGRKTLEWIFGKQPSDLPLLPRAHPLLPGTLHCARSVQTPWGYLCHVNSLFWFDFANSIALQAPSNLWCKNKRESSRHLWGPELTRLEGHRPAFQRPSIRLNLWCENKRESSPVCRAPSSPDWRDIGLLSKIHPTPLRITPVGKTPVWEYLVYVIC